MDRTVYFFRSFHRRRVSAYVPGIGDTVVNKTDKAASFIEAGKQEKRNKYASR